MFVDLRLCNYCLCLTFVLRTSYSLPYIYIRNRCPSNNINEEKSLGPSGELGTPQSLTSRKTSPTLKCIPRIPGRTKTNMSDLRQRQVPSSKEPSNQQPAKQQKKKGEKESNGTSTGISILDIIRVLVTLVVASCGLSYYTTSSESLLWGYRPWFTRWPLVVQYIVSTPFRNIHRQWLQF